jgi:pimeloyl-ACP methyl ester carboxylesterase
MAVARVEGPSAGTPLVLIPGAVEGIDFWTPIVSHLAFHAPLVLFDPRGFGETSAGEGALSVELLADDVVALLDALELPTVHLLGHSFGSAIAFEVGRRAPERVGSVTLVSGMYPGPQFVQPAGDLPPFSSRRESDPRKRVEHDIRVRVADGFEERHPERFEWLVQSRLSRPDPSRLYMRQTRAGLQFLTTDRLAEGYPCPMCLVYGDADRGILPENGRRVQQRVPGAQLTVLPAVGHLVPVEAPDVLAELVGAFLQGVGGEGSVGLP